MPLNISKKTIGLWLGLVLFALFLMVPVPEGLSHEAWKNAGGSQTDGLTWWIAEAIPIAATALLPVVLFPIMGVISIEDTVSPYAHPLIFLFLGGFIIAIAMEKCDLHRRIALNIVHTVGTKPQSIIFGFMVASAFLSMWVSNTATALMMLPIVLSVIKLSDQEKAPDSDNHNFELVLLLGVAYGCNIGGMGTLIGTPLPQCAAGRVYVRQLRSGNWLCPVAGAGYPVGDCYFAAHVCCAYQDGISGADAGASRWFGTDTI
ncbi:MAG: SLC13 family permease [Balneolaceae bacterium]|nr:SLC13 family permease [Balneolaceae bacterium]